MKKTGIAFFILLVSARLFAQQTTIPISTQPHNNGPDSIVTPDPNNKELAKCVITYPSGKTNAYGLLRNNKKDGIWKTIHLNGCLKMIEEYKDGIRNGISVQLKDNGQIERDETYSNGILNGTRTLYNYGGTPKLIENYKNGILEGEKKTFYENGKLQEEGVYKNGQRDGMVSWYSQEAKLSLQYTYVNGELNGPAKTFNSKGLCESEGKYVNDNEQGEWKYYDLDGQLDKTVIFDKGKSVKETIAKKKPLPVTPTPDEKGIKVK